MVEEFNPYQSPQIVEPRQPVGFGRVAIPFESGHTRAIWAMALLGVIIFLSLLHIYSSWLQYDLLDQAKHGKGFTLEVGQENDLRQASIGGLVLLTWIATATAFLMWTHRVYRNLPALGASNLELTPGWAVGWYFIPFANFVKPYTTTAEIWRHSDPDGIGINACASSTALVGCWWCAYMGAAAVVIVGSAVVGGGEPNTIDSLLGATAVLMLSRAVSIVSAIFAILVVARIDRFQQERIEKISGREPTGYTF